MSVHSLAALLASKVLIFLPEPAIEHVIVNEYTY